MPRPMTQLANFINILRGRMYLCQKMGGKERVVKSVSAKDDLVASSELIDAVEDLIPCVLGHEADERIQRDDGLLIQMVENGFREGVGTRTLLSRMMNIRS